MSQPDSASPTPMDSSDVAVEALIDAAYQRMLSANDAPSAQAYFQHLLRLMQMRSPERQLALEVQRREPR